MTTTTKAITEMTPVEIDTVLAANWGEVAKLRGYLASTETYIKRAEAGDRFYVRDLEKNLDRAAGYKAEIAALEAEVKPFTAEFTARGGWNRYFLVTNTNGHVHRGMNCSTCFADTSYSWVIDLADCNEAEMVAEYGEMACTICFPSAPTMKGFGDGTSTYARRTADEKAARAAEKDARNAAKAAKTLETGLRFMDLNDWRVETVAGAKGALREAIAARLTKDRKETWEYAGYFATKAAKAEKVEADARYALTTKGVTAEEMAKIETAVAKKVSKEYGI